MRQTVFAFVDGYSSLDVGQNDQPGDWLLLWCPSVVVQCIDNDIAKNQASTGEGKVLSKISQLEHSSAR